MSPMPRMNDNGCVSRNVYKNLAEVSVAYLSNEPVPDNALDAVHAQLGSYDKTHELYSSVLSCVMACLRLSKLEHAQAALADSKIPEDAQKDIIMIVQNHKSKLSGPSRNSFYPKIERFRWRIDITISSSVLARVLEPTLLFEVMLRDGRKKVFEVSVAKFHQIRYSVATVLKEMENLEKKKLLKN